MLTERLFLDNRTNIQMKCRKAHLQARKISVTLYRNKISMTMNKKLLTVALSLTVIPSALLAQKPATEHTIRANEAVKTELNFNDRQDYEDGALSQASTETPYWTKTARYHIL